MSAVPSTALSVGLNAAVFAKHLSQKTALPAWWLEAKKAAWNQFLALPMPKRGDERWRFSNTASLSIDGFALPEEVAPQVPVLAIFPRTAEIVFSNGHVLSRTPLSPELAAKGVIFCTLEEAIISHGELVRTYFQKWPVQLGSEKFVALNTALTASGAFLYVPKGVEITEPFAVQHTLSGADKATFPHTIAVLGEQAKATLVEFLVSGEATGRQLVSGVNDLYAGIGAHLTYVGTQSWTKETLAFQTNTIVTDRDARVVSLNLHLGGRQARHESHSRLIAPGAHSEMLALTIADGEQEFDQRTLQTHQAPHTTSNLLYKNVLRGKSKTVFPD